MPWQHPWQQLTNFALAGQKALLPTMDRMPRIQRPSIRPHLRPIPTNLDQPLRRVVAALAQAYERAKPEFVDVAVMRLRVIANRRRLDDTALEAKLAKRVREQLMSSDPSPTRR